MNKYAATFHWTVGSDWAHQPLRLFLRERAGISRRALAAIKFEGGLILRNGKEVTVRELVMTGDVVTICFPPEKLGKGLFPQHLPLDILYEDDHLLVINKTAGMATIPSRQHPVNTLAHAVIGYYEKKGIPTTFHPVNRLDRDTSGLLLVAKHRFAHDKMVKLQRAGKVKRAYEAFVEGVLKEKEGTINAPIARSSDSVITRCVREDGKPARTHYVVKNEFKSFSHVEIELETGRTHQIRVHFSHLGHPLLGDDLYGGNRDFICRQALHCFRLTFVHPFSEATLTFVQPLPPDMKAVIDRMNETSQE